MRLFTCSVRGIYANKDFFKWLSVILSEIYVLLVALVRNMRDMSVILQWKVIDERDSGNIFVNNH